MILETDQVPVKPNPVVNDTRRRRILNPAIFLKIHEKVLEIITPRFKIIKNSPSEANLLISERYLSYLGLVEPLLFCSLIV